MVFRLSATRVFSKMMESTETKNCHYVLMCEVVLPLLSCLAKTWSVSLKLEERASCPPLSTSPWRTSTCGSLRLKTAVRATFGFLIIIDLMVCVKRKALLWELLTFFYVCVLICSKCSVQPVCRVEPLGHHHGRSLHCLLSQPQLWRVVHLQWLQVDLNASGLYIELMHEYRKKIQTETFSIYACCRCQIVVPTERCCRLPETEKCKRMTFSTADMPSPNNKLRLQSFCHKPLSPFRKKIKSKPWLMQILLVSTGQFYWFQLALFRTEGGTKMVRLLVCSTPVETPRNQTLPRRGKPELPFPLFHTKKVDINWLNVF